MGGHQFDPRPEIGSQRETGGGREAAGLAGLPRARSCPPSLARLRLQGMRPFWTRLSGLLGGWAGWASSRSLLLLLPYDRSEWRAMLRARLVYAASYVGLCWVV